jgi:hypothetical protein
MDEVASATRVPVTYIVYVPRLVLLEVETEKVLVAAVKVI